MNTSEMTRKELRAAAKANGIRYGKMSLLQIRNALADVKPSAAKSKKGEPKVRKQREGTKLGKCVELFKANDKMARKGLIALFMDKAKISKACANTYISLVRKKVME